MKNIFKAIIISLASIFAMSMTACKSNDSGVTVAPAGLTFTTDGGTQTVAVTSESDWTVTSDSWIETAKSNNFLSVTVGATDIERTGKITVTNADGKEAAVTIKQEAPTPVDDGITVAPSSLTFVAEGGTQAVEITSESDWAYDSESWIEANRSGNSLNITVAASLSAREGLITVTNAGGKKAFIAVKQAAPVEGSEITVDSDIIMFTAAGNTHNVTVTCGVEWTVASDSWIETSKSGNSLAITVGATEVAREGVITLKTVDGNDAIVTVRQDDAIDIDSMVGTWHITEKYYYVNYGQNRFKVNNHALVMTKESDTRLKMEGFAGYWAGPTEGEVVAYAEFDSFTNTFTLLAQDILPSWSYNTFLSGVREDGDWSMSRDLNVSALVDENFSFKLWCLEVPSIDDDEGTDFIAYHISYSLGNNYIGLFWLTFNSEWKKFSDSTAFPPEWWWQD